MFVSASIFQVLSDIRSFLEALASVKKSIRDVKFGASFISLGIISFLTFAFKVVEAGISRRLNPLWIRSANQNLRSSNFVVSFC